MKLQKDAKSPAIESFISGATKVEQICDYFLENVKCLTFLVKQCEATVYFDLK